MIYVGPQKEEEYLCIFKGLTKMRLWNIVKYTYSFSGIQFIKPAKLH